MEQKINQAILLIDNYLTGLLNELGLDKLTQEQSTQTKDMLAKSLEQYLIKVFLSKMNDESVELLNQKITQDSSLEEIIDFMSTNVPNYDLVLREAMDGFARVLKESYKQV